MEKLKISAQLRQRQICQMLHDRPSASVKELAKFFNVSEMTIHRDIAKLEQTDKVRRTYGAVLPAERMIFEFDFSARRAANHKAKQDIAREALKLVKSGDKLILDTGTTTLELAFLLKDFEQLTVITPSLAVASVLQFSHNIQTVLLGGIIRKGSPDLTGAVTEATLDMFAVDIAFQGADAIGLNGELFNTDMRIAKVDMKMRQRARQTYILCDSSKIGRIEFASNGSLKDVDALITDSKINPEQVSGLESIGTKIIIAK